MNKERGTGRPESRASRVALTIGAIARSLFSQRSEDGKATTGIRQVNGLRVLEHGGAEQPPAKLAVRLHAAIVAAALFGCAAQPEKEESSEAKCPAFTRPDTVRQHGLSVRGCTDRHGNVVCVEAGGKLHCRTDDGASLINAADDWQ